MVKKWKNIKPHTMKSRQNMFKKYGPSCFLQHKTLKYPVCNKYNGKKECIGHYAAQYYLTMNISKLKKKRNKKSHKKRKQYIAYMKKSKKYTRKHCHH